MKLQNKTIGIWGYGRVGKSAAQLCAKLGAAILIYDANKNTLNKCVYPCAQSIDELLEKCDYVIASPGINITPYKKQFSAKWLNELDLFQSLFHKKIIAITGSIGKTSVTHMLTQTLQAAGWHVQAAGNIGTPMLTMIEKQSELDAIILEVSSFQLEHAQSFAPDLAIWTNLHPNHLDRHTTMQNYCDAKYQILAHQSDYQSALASIQLKHEIESRNPDVTVSYFDPTQKPQLHPFGFASNWLIIEKALDLLHVPFPQTLTISPLEHRLENVCMIRGATIINDSKSTTPASTLAAIKSLDSPRILLFLGGLSKGIDRSKLIVALSKNVRALCFGAESHTLFELCKKYSIPATLHATMKDAVSHCMQIIHPNDTVLFSPSGSSFDEFDNFEHRGNQFKKLILSYKS
jgi:UDP-N-acetylmuramoylalanine--D-glutamate ligase